MGLPESARNRTLRVSMEPPLDKFKNGREYEAYYFTYTERNQDGTLPESITKSGYWKINCSEEEEIYNDDGREARGMQSYQRELRSCSTQIKEETLKRKL
ncbi:hypothetical protein FNV43_RR19533 [Rhamnella rubrinervis]|uniref:Uncharacterized protein n=1 Tax=Rhamnella rubrinervis TaxID=2594499 RepID=A0A8K0GWC2_9ROSA|nr:hypothetical protein FNV43_RR19533 [Rhamnella rubrinervis]